MNCVGVNRVKNTSETKGRVRTQSIWSCFFEETVCQLNYLVCFAQTFQVEHFWLLVTVDTLGDRTTPKQDISIDNQILYILMYYVINMYMYYYFIYLQIKLAITVLIRAIKVSLSAYACNCRHLFV